MYLIFTSTHARCLADALDQVGNVRFALPVRGPRVGRGNWTSAPKKALVRRCAEGVRKDIVAVRPICRANFLYGKMYLTDEAKEQT